MTLSKDVGLVGPDNNPVFSASQGLLLAKIQERFIRAGVVPHIIGEDMFTVNIDESDELMGLVVKARSLRDLSFEEKFVLVNKLTVDALPVNAVEMARGGDKVAENLVYSTHPLSDALKSRLGCCRYDGALFFILGREANLGKSHFMFTQRMTSRLFTVYNVLFDENNNRHLVSIYNQTLSSNVKDKFGYPEPKQATAEDFAPEKDYYAYFSTPEGKPVIIKTRIQNRGDKENWGKFLV